MMLKKFLTCFLLLLSISVFGIEVIRQLDKTSIDKGGAINVTLIISKGSENGIGKLVEDIPSGFKVTNVQGSGGKVIPDKDGKLKLVWLTMSPRATFTVKYTLTHVKNSTGKFYLGGTFSFLKGDRKEEYSVLTSSISVGASANVLAEENSMMNHSPKVKSSIVGDSAIYSVQIGAYGNFKSESEFKGLPDIYYKKTRGLFKYYSGKTSKLKAEKILRQAIKKGYKNAFIVKR